MTLAEKIFRNVLLPVYARPQDAHPRRRVQTNAERQGSFGGCWLSPSRSWDTTLTRRVISLHNLLYLRGDQTAIDFFAHTPLVYSEIHLNPKKVNNVLNPGLSRLLNPLLYVDVALLLPGVNLGCLLVFNW